jgi:Ca2+-binding EF-hand superfamily protein
VFDLNNNGYLDNNEFIAGMKMLFSETYDNLVKFIFDFYDFDKDGKISKEDIHTILCYIPLTTKEKLSGYKLKFEE